MDTYKGLAKPKNGSMGEQKEGCKKEAKIASLEKSSDEQSETLAAVLTEMAGMQARHEAEERRLKHENEELKSQNADLKDRLKQMEEDMDDRNAMSEYAKVIKEASPDVVDSVYVVKLKSQLCRALHQVGVLQNQVDRVQRQRDQRAKELRSKIADGEDQQSRAEMEFMNDLFVMEREGRAMKEEYEERLASAYAMVAELQMDLDIQREKKSEALSYVRHMKEEKEIRQLMSNLGVHDSPAEAYEELNDTPMMTEVEELKNKIREKEETERHLREELNEKVKFIEELQNESSDQQQNIKKVRVDLKKLNYRSSQYASAAASSMKDKLPPKQAPKRVSGTARTA